jgi:hypothetical protein
MPQIGDGVWSGLGAALFGALAVATLIFSAGELIAYLEARDVACVAHAQRRQRLTRARTSAALDALEGSVAESLWLTCEHDWRAAPAQFAWLYTRECVRCQWAEVNPQWIQRNKETGKETPQ